MRTIFFSASWLSIILFALSFISTAQAGQEDPSHFDPVRYSSPHKAVYHFNFAKPLDAFKGLRRVKNHLKALQEFGAPDGHLVVIINGNEIHAFSRLNAPVYPEMYKMLTELASQGVEFRACRNAAKARGYKSDEFYDLVTVAPSAVSELARYGNAGYTYIYTDLHPRITRATLISKNPELDF
jgi:uncharacterized protein